MEAIEAILTRRSVRRYTDEEVSEEKITQILEAGMSAPSAHNRQPWDFIILKDKDKMNAITGFHPYSQMLKGAMAAIIVCAEPDRNGENEFWQHDCAAATENILIAINALGLGGVWLGVHPHEDIKKGLRELLAIPENIHPFSIVPIGVPEFIKGKHKDRFKKELIHIDVW